MKRFLAILSIVGVVAGVARAQQPGLHKTCKRRHSTVRGDTSSPLPRTTPCTKSTFSG
jgi:hypothetical protein